MMGSSTTFENEGKIEVKNGRKEKMSEKCENKSCIDCRYARRIICNKEDNVVACTKRGKTLSTSDGTLGVCSRYRVIKDSDRIVEWSKLNDFMLYSGECSFTVLNPNKRNKYRYVIKEKGNENSKVWWLYAVKDGKRVYAGFIFLDNLGFGFNRGKTGRLTEEDERVSIIMDILNSCYTREIDERYIIYSNMYNITALSY